MKCDDHYIAVAYDSMQLKLYQRTGAPRVVQSVFLHTHTAAVAVRSAVPECSGGPVGPDPRSAA